MALAKQGDPNPPAECVANTPSIQFITEMAAIKKALYDILPANPSPKAVADTDATYHELYEERLAAELQALRDRREAAAVTGSVGGPPSSYSSSAGPTPAAHSVVLAVATGDGVDT